MSSDNIRRSLNKITQAYSDHQEAVRRLQLAIHYFSEAKTHLMMIESSIKESRGYLQSVVDIGKMDSVVKSIPKPEKPISPRDILQHLEDSESKAKSLYKDAPEYDFQNRLKTLLEQSQEDADALLAIKHLARNMWAKATHDYSTDEEEDEGSESESESESESQSEADKSEDWDWQTEKVVQQRIHKEGGYYMYITSKDPYQGYLVVSKQNKDKIELGTYRIDAPKLTSDRLKEYSASGLIKHGHAKRIYNKIRVAHKPDGSYVYLQTLPSGNYTYA